MNTKEQPTIRREVTSIKIRPDLWKKAKIEAIQHDIDLSELVEKAIIDWIEKEAKSRLKKDG